MMPHKAHLLCVETNCESVSLNNSTRCPQRWRWARDKRMLPRILSCNGSVSEYWVSPMSAGLIGFPPILRIIRSMGLTFCSSPLSPQTSATVPHWTWSGTKPGLNMSSKARAMADIDEPFFFFKSVVKSDENVKKREENGIIIIIFWTASIYEAIKSDSSRSFYWLLSIYKRNLTEHVVDVALWTTTCFIP